MVAKIYCVISIESIIQHPTNFTTVDDRTEKDISHCDKCGFCRIGKVGSLSHCDDCGLCWNTSAFDAHVCNKKIANDEVCPICFESVHNSQKQPRPLSKTLVSSSSS